MRTTRTTYLRRRRGVSTILGTLIFIGILFTAVIPMFLVMKQADNIYTQNVHEMEISDQDRAREDIKSYVYPLNATSNDIYVKVANTGVLPVEIVRVWINDINYSQTTLVASQDTQVIGPITITPQNGSNIVTLTTKRGNCFGPTTETLYYDFNDGYWFTPSLGIHIIVINVQGKYKIWVHNSTCPLPWNVNGQILAYDTDTNALDHGEIECTQLIDALPNGLPHDYTVVVQKKVGNDYKNVRGTPVPVVVVWPGGSPVISVIVDGRGT